MFTQHQRPAQGPTEESGRHTPSIVVQVSKQDSVQDSEQESVQDSEQKDAPAGYKVVLSKTIKRGGGPVQLVLNKERTKEEDPAYQFVFLDKKTTTEVFGGTHTSEIEIDTELLGGPELSTRPEYMHRWLSVLHAGNALTVDHKFPEEMRILNKELEGPMVTIERLYGELAANWNRSAEHSPLRKIGDGKLVLIDKKGVLSTPFNELKGMSRDIMLHNAQPFLASNHKNELDKETVKIIPFTGTSYADALQRAGLDMTKDGDRLVCCCGDRFIDEATDRRQIHLAKLAFGRATFVDPVLSKAREELFVEPLRQAAEQMGPTNPPSKEQQEMEELLRRVEALGKEYSREIDEEFEGPSSTSGSSAEEEEEEEQVGTAAAYSKSGHKRSPSTHVKRIKDERRKISRLLKEKVREAMHNIEEEGRRVEQEGRKEAPKLKRYAKKAGREIKKGAEEAVSELRKEAPKLKRDAEEVGEKIVTGAKEAGKEIEHEASEEFPHLMGELEKDGEKAEVEGDKLLHEAKTEGEKALVEGEKIFEEAKEEARDMLKKTIKDAETAKELEIHTKRIGGDLDELRDMELDYDNE